MQMSCPLEVPILKPTKSGDDKRLRKELDSIQPSPTLKPLVDSPVPSHGNGSESDGGIEFGQETISILVIVGVCVLLGVANVIIWLFGCRRHAKNNAEERQDRRLERDRFNDKQRGGTPGMKKKKVADKTSIMKKGDTGKSEKVLEEVENNHPRLESKINATETIEEFESRIRDQFSPANVLNEIKEERQDELRGSTQNLRGKRVDEVNVELSVETLERNDSKVGHGDPIERRPEKAPFHRNDSKVNVFNTDRVEEIDFNPALNSSINLETI